MAEPSHAQLRERETRAEAPKGGDTGIDDPGAVAELVNAEPQLAGPVNERVGQRVCAVIHAEIGHRAGHDNRNAGDGRRLPSDVRA
jgi:hypothetical protein